MARPVRKQFKSANEGTIPVVANDEALLKKAQDTVRVKQEVARQNLLHLQGLEIKHLENERKFIGQEKAKDVTTFNNKEIAAINHRVNGAAIFLKSGAAKFPSLAGLGDQPLA
jgi:hypothetical protein